MTTLGTLVEAYAAAKSRQDAAAALAVCSDDFVLDTPAFGTRSLGQVETAAQLQLFFAAFPDYHVELEGRLAGDDTVACWGTAIMTLRGALLDIAPTGRTAHVPFVSIFTARAGRLTGERFYFDLATLCRQLGLSADRVTATLAQIRDERGEPTGAEVHA